MAFSCYLSSEGLYVKNRKVNNDSCFEKVNQLQTVLLDKDILGFSTASVLYLTVNTTQ